MSEVEFLEMRLGTFFLKLHFFLKFENNRQIYLQKLIRQATWFFVNTQVSNKIDDPETMWPIDKNESGATTEIETEVYQEKLKQLIELSKSIWQSQ
jgi:hypothetical protein